MKDKFKIPLDKDGNVVWRPDYKKEYTWKDNYHFNGSLSLIGHIKHGTSLKYIFESHDKIKKYEVFCIDLEDIMKHMIEGKIIGTFKYVCRGGNYGIKLVHSSI